MGMARQNERSANNALSDLLRGMMHGCEVRSESTRTISEQSGSQPDILITAADRAPCGHRGRVHACCRGGGGCG